MTNETAPLSDRPLRVQLVTAPGAASDGLRGFLAECEGVAVAGPVAWGEALALAAEFRPHVILLDFHGLPIAIARPVALFKQLAPPPLVFVLTHDASAAMRRRCRDARVDAVFDKTTEFELLAHHLEQARVQPD